MWAIERILHPARVIGIATFLTGALLSGGVAGKATGIEPEAEALLKAATTYVSDQKQFTVDTESAIEVVLESGQKIQFDHLARLSLQRPNKLRAERSGDLVDQVFYYDGKSLTLHNPSDQVYATVAAPSNLEDMLDFARESLDIIAPAGDLLYKNAFEILMQDTESGFVVGKSIVAGERCDHLAFRGPEVDWQIWIQEGSIPLPRKLVITSRDVMNAPQFEVVMTQWNLSPEFDDQIFSFTPPDGSLGVEFLPVAGSDVQAQ